MYTDHIVSGIVKYTFIQLTSANCLTGDNDEDVTVVTTI